MNGKTTLTSMMLTASAKNSNHNGIKNNNDKIDSISSNGFQQAAKVPGVSSTNAMNEKKYRETDHQDIIF